MIEQESLEENGPPSFVAVWSLRVMAAWGVLTVVLLMTEFVFQTGGWLKAFLETVSIGLGVILPLGIALRHVGGAAGLSGLRS